MFKLTDETRSAIIDILKNRFGLTQRDEDISSVIDEIVAVVKAQFGM